MSTYLIDQGNSRIKLASYDASTVTLMDEFISPSDFNWPGIANARVWVSSVASHDKAQLLRNCLDRAGIIQRWVTVRENEHRLPTRYNADQLGVDRWLASLAAYQHCRGTCLIVDSGTATTLDLVDSQGIHQGGYILPGFELMERALMQGTAIPERVFADNNPPIATETAAAITLGAPRAVAALVESLVSREPDTKLYLGGGGAFHLVEQLSIPYVKVDQMVLNGLARLVDMESA